MYVRHLWREYKPYPVLLLKASLVTILMNLNKTFLRTIYDQLDIKKNDMQVNNQGENRFQEQ
ncbi:hypothetical protein CU666_12650 [Pseudomonas syringae pv. actinidifoliorum]|nr:hypothetical protein [Pseudomonas syringae pv. actinidifoliorum]